ncbi:LOW QUALITY PROTEIN: hypothetical protein U9M48_005424 [Paspalum notatum var. saurae]|uniref:Pectinesterase n=1 Tax=Paspalum notatum var. saurae TaxID=547442 RepID=A0AAQ3PLV0_PASNO
MAAVQQHQQLLLALLLVLVLLFACGGDSTGAGTARLSGSARLIDDAAAGRWWPPISFHAVVDQQQKTAPAPPPGAGPPTTYTTIVEALTKGAGGRNQSDERKRYVILIKAGRYEETFNITGNNIILVGEGIDHITGNKSNMTSTDTVASATVGAVGDGFVAYNLTIQNTAGPANRQAVALRSKSNKSIVYKCRIEGYEDTLYAENGQQLYVETEIAGTVDFVFGNARAVFHKCSLLVRVPLHGKHNVITAQSCNNTSLDSGFVFQSCHVAADEGHAEKLKSVDTFLGRPHKDFSHVVFMGCDLGDVVNSTGWVPWKKDEVIESVTRTVTYIEFRNYGPGAASDTRRRVNWTGVQVLTEARGDVAKAEKYTADLFIGANQWVPAEIPYERGMPPPPPPPAN